ncbi:hypothetical protein MF271_01795 (plasmid) [Deinococcus sp. KNUC1210]|uniref:hypothetical protein n=1 Tax=Deinococcus sp. KNUC1210 TaxID=2917691 RepID=UPI001EF10E93|nr:hypothetical protein [Deinococcus sp. KNUC1210]ULH14279.1 hypothetical protein MF271_01795 [Deinococcus sp. KNUC1210]
MQPDTTAFGSVTAHVEPAALSGQISALEGGGGYMRVVLNGADALNAGQEFELEMHDGARFRVVVIESLPSGGAESVQEYRLKLLGRGSRAGSS